MPGQLANYTIVHVLTTVRHGGAERVVLDLAREQRSRGADAQVVCLQALGDLLPEFQSAGIPVQLLDGAERAGALRTAWRLAHSLRRSNPTVVHTHNSAPQVAAGLGAKFRRWPRANTGLVHTEHGRLGDVRPRLLQARRWAATEFDAIIAVSADARLQLLEHGIQTSRGVDVVPNAVDLSRFRPRLAAPASPSARIVHVGRLDQIKGQDVLLAAMPMVRAAVPHAHLTIVGDGPNRSALEEQAKQLDVHDIVTFAGATDNVQPFLAAADIFVLPSRSEGISLALLEAMATGLPVVATDVGGNREVVSDSCGTLVPAEQPAQLAEAMVALLQQPIVAATKGAAGRREVEQRFNSEQTMQAYIRHYDRARAAHADHRMESAA